MNDETRIVQIGERAFAALRERGILPSPENYLVWYTHLAGENPALSRMIRLLEQNRDSFDAKRCRELYARYFLRSDMQRTLAEATDRIKGLTERLGDLLAHSGEESARASSRFEAAARALATTCGLEEIRRVVVALDAEARRMAAETRTLGCELQRSSREVAELQSHLERMQREVETDPLTGVGNRRHFDVALKRLAARSLEDGTPLSMMLADIDHFKRFNDTFGHDVGDVVLRLVAGVIRRGVRDNDVVARFGGEEFAVLMPGVELAEAAAVAERLRATVAGRRLRSREDGRDLGMVTLSIGLSAYCPGEPLDRFFRRVDSALYEAKQGGRNRVVVRDVEDRLVNEEELARAGRAGEQARASA
ncbi:Diguanylate cyclase VdcA [bacterium HR40]|nr:Diguanylate cyclase VdcA [bacterium HR40]